MLILFWLFHSFASLLDKVYCDAPIFIHVA
uniref:Uncharacterized protein n=1 Tax=Anguilla anguilla TaxID=7936 RepID=A0A0E9TF62_ANGAN